MEDGPEMPGDWRTPRFLACLVESHLQYIQYTHKTGSSKSFPEKELTSLSSLGVLEQAG